MKQIMTITLLLLLGCSALEKSIDSSAEKSQTPQIIIRKPVPKDFPLTIDPKSSIQIISPSNTLHASLQYL